MLFETLVIVILSSSTQCAKVIDAGNQKGIHLTDYCPKMKYCPEGAHVMCMFYDQNNAMGPKCRDPKNVTITAVLANKLVDIVNAIRSKVSRGQEKGFHMQHLPRGYGIFRLKWDSELATFAQVLANQCTLRHDFCRATKKFPDPGQAVGIVRFQSANWFPVSPGAKNLTSKGLNEEKLMYAITQALRTWYSQKSKVTIQMVTNYPDWRKNTTNQGRLYLSMIYGAATHMGCGITAYSDYKYYGERASGFYNTVLVICNFSGQPRQHAAVYNTVPPTDTDSSFNACGCPVGSLEDDDCLCLEVSREPEENTHSHKTKTCPAGINCDPTVVLLPIFTVEDAPPEKLATPERLGNSSLRHTIPEDDNTIDSFEELFDSNLSGNKETLRKSRKTLELQPQANFNGKRQRVVQHSSGVTVRSRHFDKPNEAVEQKDSNPLDNRKPIKQSQGHMQRSSVFTKSPIFELPGAHYFLSSIKRDVIPRKDFSTGKQLVNKYLYNKNSMVVPKDRPTIEHSHENTVISLNEAKSVETEHQANDLHANAKLKQHKGNYQHHEEVHFHDILTTETVLSTVEQKVINHKESNELNQFQNLDKLEENTGTEDNDKKFMALLDTLEQEVKHIELHDKEKQIFDAKIKKIYGRVVGKPTDTLVVSEKKHVENVKKNKIHGNAQKPDDDDNGVHKLLPSFDVKEDDSNIIDELNYQSKNNNFEAEIDDNNAKTDTTDVEPDDIEKPMVKKLKPLSNYDDRDKYDRRNRNFRQKKRNFLSSREFTRHRYEGGYKGRKTNKKAFRNDFDKLRHRSNSLDYKRKNYYTNDAYEDILSNERRKYYQDKLDSMERKLQDARRYNRRKDAGRSPHMRPMKPTFTSDNQMNPLYNGRARILHGY